jgi:hypothetical protein
MEHIKRILCGISLVFAIGQGYAQSPHGKDLQISCDACHTSDSWVVSRDSVSFLHDSTRFSLEGQHEVIDCRQCHTTLEFSQAETKCASCHLDVHQQSVGDDCARCHDSKSWLVNNITELHRQNSFPLQGAHVVANCNECHKSDTDLRFDPLGTDCLSCHQEDYAATSEPNHEAAGFSINCVECHKVDAFEWTGTGINHDFFPLTQGHDINECSSCHIGSDYSKISSDCFSCHEGDFLATTNPNHQAINLSTSCVECHTTQPGWKPADYKEHDSQYFPIYSGEHNGVWDNCAECHTDPNNYAEFTCITCHSNPETDDEHDEVLGYSYSSTACLACHPNGSEEGNFDHNNTNFPLTGSHTTVECLDCHTNGFTDTPTACFACHTVDFDQSTNPNHAELGLSNDCASCHTTEPDWNPATFANHNDFYVLSGAHATIANDCASCHNGDYTNTPTTCVGCHQGDYDQTTNPSHTELSFSTDCIMCHSENAWIPATFDHDGQYFPIYSGSHEGEWSACIDCHTTPGNFAEYTCITCHANPETAEQHSGVAGYTYNSVACLACHPTGEADGAFDHNSTMFPLTGAHNAVDCFSCHTNGFEGTPTDCQACHTQDFNQAVNPNHAALGFSMECATCHTTEPGWSPATLDNHNEYYVLSGAHAAIANQCASCHNGDYTNTPNTCAGCHQQDFNQTTDPNHLALQFSTDCATCHSESAWVPSTFDHDNQYFPIYSGEHEGEWDQCIDCHTTPGNYAIFTCLTCHSNPETNEEHNGVNGYLYNSTACLACHPTGSEAVNFDHNMTAFPLTGGHTTANCTECHAGGFEGVSMDCFSCHQAEFNQSANPNHSALGLSTDCISCHTTEPGWSPANFANHNEYYVLSGAHATLANQCVACHNGDYTNTPNTCSGCHLDDYNQTTNPPHLTLQFSQDCASCHTESAWEPSTFDHDAQYFPINSGSHEGEWAQCIDCHNSPGNWPVFTCTTCHANPETNEEHTGVNGYVYSSPACLACHPNGEGDFGFDHNNTAFPLTGAHITVNCLDCHAAGFEGTPTECVACHTGSFNESLNPNHVAIGLPMDCASCHTTAPDWNPASFPIHNEYYVLNGAHAIIANQCVTCHNGDYTNTPNTCAGCHQDDYNQTTNPSHTTLQFSTDCATCHTESVWMPASMPNHSEYYMLNGAHASIANECALCHNGNYNNTPNTCVGCHLEDFNNTSDPSHTASGFGTDCASCHSEMAWEPATFNHDAQFFPIYSGEHQGEWDQCNDCHTNPNDYSVFTCITCHANPETNEQHAGVNGYAYSSPLCLACHPTGNTEGMFNHNQTNFPLTGSHTSVDCLDCHTAGFEGTPTECNACHTTDFNQAVNPNHLTLGLPTDCASCHTTAPNWNPASFGIHNQYYVLNGAHATIADQCVSCHNGDYNNTPSTCVGCHQDDYNQTNNPSHVSLNFSTDCASCHTESAWSPAVYSAHDQQFFPIYSGAHQGTWDQCTDCHTNTNNYSIFTCTTCHTSSETNQDHNGVNGYFYESSACLACHPTGNGDESFNHNESDFPLTGAHTSVSCIECHANGYENTPTACNACHTPDYNQATNPNHNSLGLSTDCVMCHTTTPNWNPALFPVHDDYYPLLGAHAAIENQCASCHNGNYTNTPSTCVGCHQDDYNQTNNPDHQAAQFPTTCTTCHSQNAWEPATWDHDDLYFPIYSGSHEGEWNQCSQCHNNANNYSVFTCLTCHQQNETNNDHDEVNGYQYNSNACLACHPDGEED